MVGSPVHGAHQLLQSEAGSFASRRAVSFSYFALGSCLGEDLLRLTILQLGLTSSVASEQLRIGIVLDLGKEGRFSVVPHRVYLT